METKKNTFALFFYINKSRQNQQGQCPIYLRISVNNSQKAVSIKRSINHNYWDSKGFPKGKTVEIRDLNNYLNAIRTKLFNIQTDLMLKETCITADMFAEALFGTSRDRSVTIMQMFNERIDKEKKLFEQGQKSEGEYSRFYYTAEYLRKFMERQYKVSDIPLKKIDRQFIDRFIDFLKLQPTIGSNYMMLLLQRFKSLLKVAVKYEMITKNPFDDDIPLAMQIDGHRNYLTEQELQRLLETPMLTQGKELEKDLFCFSVFTGLANTDLQHLTCGRLHQIDGNWWIRAYRQKTDVLSVVPLLPQAEVILRKYCPDFESCSANHPIFTGRSISNRNVVLKKIAKECKIDKKLTTHVARHTFATTITLSNDVPLETVSKMLGHKSLRMTQHYAKIIDKKIGRDMEKLTAKISGTYQLHT